MPGLFLRHYLGQTPTSNDPGAGWTDSPDIWLNWDNTKQPEPAPSPDALRQRYDSESRNTFFLNESNFIYVRGLDTDNADVTARLWLYWTESNVVVWPQQWHDDAILVADEKRNWVDVKATAAQPIAVSDPPFVVTPPNPSAGQHYCLIAFAQTPPSDTSPKPTGAIGNWNDLARFVQANPHMAWRNTCDVPASQPSTWTINAPITGAEAGGTFYLGALCQKMPVGGAYDIYVPGPDEQGSINLTGVPIKNPNQSFMVPITWPPGYKRSMTIVYHGAGAPAPGPGAEIIPITGSLSASLEGVLDDPYHRAVKVTTYASPALDGPEEAHMIFTGSIPFAIKNDSTALAPVPHI